MNKPALATACLLLLGVAHAVDFPNMPPLKEGLWKIRMIDNTPGQKPTDNTYTFCRNHAWDEQARQLAKKVLVNCATPTDTTSGNSRTVITSCKIANSTIVTKSTLTSTGDTFFHTETHATFTPPLYGQSQDSMIQEQTFLGACPAGMQPGDRQLADGTIQHHR
jgi:hypothetical protein